MSSKAKEIYDSNIYLLNRRYNKHLLNNLYNHGYLQLRKGRTNVYVCNYGFSFLSSSSIEKQQTNRIFIPKSFSASVILQYIYVTN